MFILTQWRYYSDLHWNIPQCYPEGFVQVEWNGGGKGVGNTIVNMKALLSFSLSYLLPSLSQENCTQSFTTLTCYAPPLDSYLSGPGVSLFPGVNYTIVMDGAPGPNLTIGVVPNPVFTSINPGDRNQTSGSVKSIAVLVSSTEMCLLVLTCMHLIIH